MLRIDKHEWTDYDVCWGEINMNAMIVMYVNMNMMIMMYVNMNMMIMTYDMMYVEER